MSVFTVGQRVTVLIPAQQGGHGQRVVRTKVMEIGRVYTEDGFTGYYLRNPGSTSKGGSYMYTEGQLSAV